MTGGSAQLPFFTDASGYYTGAYTSAGPQSIGLAGRITVNPELVANPSRLVVYQTSPMTAAGDATRPNFIYDQLSSAALAYAPQAGIGSQATPYSGTLGSYLQQMISQQGQAASAADSLKQGQDIVVNSLQQRLNTESGVNMDTEMATLLQLQNAYGANARVMTTVRDLMQLLMQM
jgi:flagellar hook-associated protein 1 FlgK